MRNKIKHLSGATALGFYSITIIGSLIWYALSKGINGVVVTTGVGLIAAISAGVGGYRLRIFKE